MGLATIDSRSEGIIDRVLSKLAEDKILVPGARAELKEIATEHRRGGVAGKVAAIFGAIEGPRGSRYLNPDKPSGQTKSFLRRLLNTLPITDKAAAKLEAEFGMYANSELDTEGHLAESEEQARHNGVPFDRKAEAGRLKAAAIANIVGKVMGELNRRETRTHWIPAFVPSLPASEVRAQKLLDRFWRYFDSSVDREALAAQWADDLGYMTTDAAKREIARRLRSNPLLCEGGVPARIPFDDPAFDESDEDREHDAGMREVEREVAGITNGRPTAPSSGDDPAYDELVALRGVRRM